MRGLAALALLIGASACATAGEPVGLYEIDQMEMAGALELRPDGRFRYVFDYGAVSEVSEGDWAMDGTIIRLTTDPMPPPAECDRGFASACFDHTPLTPDGENFILSRWDARIILKPVQRAPSK